MPLTYDVRRKELHRGIQMKTIASIALPLIAFASLGLLSGWFIGASNSPISGTLLTSTFTLFGLVLTVVLALQQAKDKAISDLRVIRTLVIIVSTGVCLFSASCWIGVQYGVQTKSHRYPTFAELLKLSAIEDATLSPNDRWRVHLIYWQLQSKGRSKEVITEFFANTIAPILRFEKKDRGLFGANALDEILTALQGVIPEKPVIAGNGFQQPDLLDKGRG